MHARYALTRAEYERELDIAIAGSFPASDPLPWTLGPSSWMDQPAPIAPMTVPDAIDVVIDDRGFAGSRVATIGEAMALTSLVPVVVLLAGLPVAALVRGIAAAIGWVLAGA